MQLALLAFIYESSNCHDHTEGLHTYSVMQMAGTIEG